MDHTKKMIVYSDALNVDKALKLKKQQAGVYRGIREILNAAMKVLSCAVQLWLPGFLVGVAILIGDLHDI